MALWQWSTTAANNATADPSINWQEGQAPSTVNDSARAMMAAIAAWFADPQWINYGLTPSYINGTQFSVAGNQTSMFSPARRVRAYVTAGVIYGFISTSVYTTLTTVTVQWDSGQLDTGLSEMDVGIVNPIESSLPMFSSASYASLLVKEFGSTNPATVSIQATGDSNGANIQLVGNGATTPNKTLRARAGNFEVVNSAYTSVILSLDDAGDLVTAGNITGSSDERLKTDWASLPFDFIERLAGIRSGTYTRIDTERRQVGVGAQSLQPLMPEAVIENDDGFLSVAYGQAALVACVELAKEVVRLRALLEPVK
jgi:hypothetical protein